MQRAALAVAVVAVAASALTACSAGDSSGEDLVRVPQDAPTISAALDEVAEGGMVLVSPGTYTESVLITTKDVTLRGTDRNGVVIDGEGLRADGVEVIADGVRVQNLTVRNHTFNGVLVTGLHDGDKAEAHNLDGYSKLDPSKYPPLQRFEVSHVTSSNNGLYGIYAFDAQHGVISDNYTSGSADSGFYVGQCPQCDTLVTRNVAEHNAVGYENANASDSIVIAGNRFTDNRVGLTLLSQYQESYLPQKKAQVVGNLIADNNSADAPAQADGGFGIGVGISGATGDELTRNLIAGNRVAGLELANTEDLPVTGTRATDNSFDGNGVDVADVSASRSPSSDTCVDPTSGLTVVPSDLLASCGGTTTAGAAASDLPQATVPPGVSFLKVKAGPDQPGMEGDLTVIPKPLPATTAMPDLTTFALPDRTLLADRATP